MSTQQPSLAICVNRRLTGQNPSCGGRNAEALATELEQALRLRGISLPLYRTDCLGRCNEGPNLRLSPQGKFLCLNGDDDPSRVLDWLQQQLPL